MSDFWMGVLVVPASIAGIGFGYLLLRAFAWLAGKVAIVGLHLGKEATQEQRAVVSSSVFGAKRCWMWALGEFGVAFYTGQDRDERWNAYEALRPQPVSLSRILKSDRDAD